MLADRPTIAERVVETGTRGEGGDRTLLIDEAAEDVVFAELQRLHDDGARFTAVSEERGVVDLRRRRTCCVVIDPIDGSLNAKRGLPHHALSIAVADGPTMADVVFGYVLRLRAGGGVVGAARRGRLPRRHAARPPDGASQSRRQLEVVAVESAEPRWVIESVDALEATAHRAARDRLDRDLAVPGRARRASTGWSRSGAAVPSTPPPRS